MPCFEMSQFRPMNWWLRPQHRLPMQCSPCLSFRSSARRNYSHCIDLNDILHSWSTGRGFQKTACLLQSDDAWMDLLHEKMRLNINTPPRDFLKSAIYHVYRQARKSLCFIQNCVKMLEKCINGLDISVCTIWYTHKSTPTRWTVESAVYIRKWDFEIIACKVYLVLKLFLLCSPVED